MSGVYLLFDGTGIENEGGNTGRGGIYDASTRTPIEPGKLTVGLVRNNDTGHVSYSMYDYIHYLMSTMTEEEYQQMIPEMQKRYDLYYERHRDEIDTFRRGNYSKKEIDLETFCRVCKNDIDKSIREANQQENSER